MNFSSRNWIRRALDVTAFECFRSRVANAFWLGCATRYTWTGASKSCATRHFDVLTWKWASRCGISSRAAPRQQGTPDSFMSSNFSTNFSSNKTDSCLTISTLLLHSSLSIPRFFAPEDACLWKCFAYIWDLQITSHARPSCVFHHSLQ